MKIYFLSFLFLILSGSFTSVQSGEPAEQLHQYRLQKGQEGPWGTWGRTLRDPAAIKAANPHIKGAHASFKWANLEPKKGQFDWSDFDKTIKSYADNKLYMTVMVMVGPAAPRWLFDEGIPEVKCDNAAKEAMGRHLGWTYPYYVDPRHEAFFHNMIRKVAEHVASFPKEVRQYIVAVQTGEGCTGDEGPYKGRPPKKYAIPDNVWNAYKERAWILWRDLYSAMDPPVQLLINQGNDARHKEWLYKNIPNVWGKLGNVGHMYQLGEENAGVSLQLFAEANSRQPNGQPRRFRSEMDDWGVGWYNENKTWNIYWLLLWNLQFGNDILQWAQDYDITSAIEGFHHFNFYAGQKIAAQSPGAFCALRDGLDAADTKRFPVKKYGDAEKKNQSRYEKIAQDFAQFGAKVGDAKSLALSGPMRERRSKALNDVGFHIYPGNYERYLTQYQPNETSQGYWRVPPADQPYGRFARGFDPKSGKTQMFFDLNDAFYGAGNTAAKSAYLRVIYLDKGTGKWELCYDSVSGEKKALSVRNADSGKWKEAVVIVDDARFANGCPHQTDLVLQYVDGDTTLFHMVEVVRK